VAGRVRRILFCVAASSVFLVAAAGLAQSGDGAHAACPTGAITQIFVDNHSVFDLADPSLDDRFTWAYRFANRMHVRTRSEVIRRELLFNVGDCYEPEVLRESERILRAAAFIADADVYGIRQPDGGYHVIVDTRDEWSFRVEPQVHAWEEGGRIGVRVREDNVLGSGRQLALFHVYRYDEPYYGVEFSTPQLFRSRWNAGVSYQRTPVGPSAVQSLTYPFVGDVGRWAFRQQTQHREHYFEYFSVQDGAALTVLFPEQRTSVDVGAVFRRGRRTQMTLLGLGVGGEWIRYPELPAVVYSLDDRAPIDTAWTPPFRGALEPVSNVRALMLLGQRNVDFARRRALDTVRGTEDIRLGVEVESAVGHTLPVLSRDRGVSLDLGIFAAGEPVPGLYTGSQANLEMRRDVDAAVDQAEWNDIYGQLDSWAYWRPHPESRHTFVASATLVGGWNTVTPFQLTLGGGAGLRGYRRNVDPGAQRLVVSLEQRSYLGWPYPRLFDLGAVGFVDAGRIWAGDVPFADESRFRASGGVGLRAAFPPGSRQTLRLDAAAPIAGNIGWRDVIVRAGIGQVIGARAVRDDPQLRRSSRRALTTSVFNFPN
jgi:hypothetical protein